MLVVIMHNNQEYLECLMRLARREGIVDITILEEKNIGTRLIGGSADFIFTRGKMIDAYDKAFIASVEGEAKTKRFLDLIEQSKDLGMINVENKGFICTIPFHYIKRFELESSCRKYKGSAARIADFLHEANISVDLKSSNKKNVIKETAVLLGNTKQIVDFDLFLKDIFERESLGTTGIGNNIAIPHARTDAVNDFVIAFGRSVKGVNFDSLDSKPVKFIFLMGTPKEKILDSYLKILAHLTRLLNKKNLQNELLKASNAEEIIEIFKRVEN